MIQTLDIITINIWSILISLANRVILFFILKRFLYKPFKKMLQQRREAIDKQYEAADAAKCSAEAIIKDAEQQAQNRKDIIISEANQKAEGIIRRAESEAELERQKADAEIKTKIAEVSAALAEKMLEREINTDDHRALIDSFINEVGDSNG